MIDSHFPGCGGGIAERLLGHKLLGSAREFSQAANGTTNQRDSSRLAETSAPITRLRKRCASEPLSLARVLSDRNLWRSHDMSVISRSSHETEETIPLTTLTHEEVPSHQDGKFYI